MKLGFFYQTANSPCAVEMNLRQIRKHYPQSPVALWEDLNDTSAYTAYKFNVDYKRVYRLPNERGGYNRSRPMEDVSGGLQYLNRLFISCLTTFKDVEWIMHFEDDVWLNGRINKMPDNDWAGGFAGQWSDALIEHLEEKGIKTGRDTLHGACGGVVFKKQLFIDAYLKIQEIEWIQAAERDPHISQYSDVYISYLLNHNKGIWNEWEQWEQGGYEDFKVYSKPVIHNIKYWYNHPLEDLDKINSREEIKFFLEKHK